MSDFWTRKREELQAKGEIPPPRQVTITTGPWWDDTGKIAMQQAMEVMSEVNSPAQDIPPAERDFSKATHLKSKAGYCPNCNSGNYVKPSATAAARCFDCGYTEGRQVNDLDTFVAMQDAKTLKVRQADSAHGIKLGSAPDKNQIAYLNSQLEASANGKALIDS